jgi:type IV secretory pathway VirB2 component (pilin)
MKSSQSRSLTQTLRGKLQANSNRVMQAWIGLNCTLLATVANAQAGGGGLNFGRVETILNQFRDFMTGPFGRAAVVISIVAAFVTWVFAPKEGIFGPVLRVVVAGIAVLNATIFVTGLGAGTA